MSKFKEYSFLNHRLEFDRKQATITCITLPYPFNVIHTISFTNLNNFLVQNTSLVFCLRKWELFAKKMGAVCKDDESCLQRE